MSTFAVFLVLLVAPSFVKNENTDANTEANLLALQTSGELLAPDHLIQKFTIELQAIRVAYPAVSNVTYSPPWVAGELLAQVSDDQLVQIRSQYGNVTSSSLFDDYKVLTFTKQYNPEVLAKELTTKKLVEYAEPNNTFHGGSSIHYDAPTGTFSQGWGEIPSGFNNAHFWEFLVSGRTRVELLKEFGTPLDEGS